MRTPFIIGIVLAAILASAVTALASGASGKPTTQHPYVMGYNWSDGQVGIRYCRITREGVNGQGMAWVVVNKCRKGYRITKATRRVLSGKVFRIHEIGPRGGRYEFKDDPEADSHSWNSINVSVAFTG